MISIGKQYSRYLKKAQHPADITDILTELILTAL